MVAYFSHGQIPFRSPWLCLSGVAVSGGGYRPWYPVSLWRAAPLPLLPTDSVFPSPGLGEGGQAACGTTTSGKGLLSLRGGTRSPWEQCQPCPQSQMPARDPGHQHEGNTCWSLTRGLSSMCLHDKASPAGAVVSSPCRVRWQSQVSNILLLAPPPAKGRVKDQDQRGQNHPSQGLDHLLSGISHVHIPLQRPSKHSWGVTPPPREMLTHVPAAKEWVLFPLWRPPGETLHLPHSACRQP